MSSPTREDSYGLTIGCVAPATVAAWDQALDLLFRFRGDPVESLASAAESDQAFIRGPIFRGVMRLLGGRAPTDPSVKHDLDLARAREPQATPEEQRHLAAFEALAAGAFTLAADTWDGILTQTPNDMLALKCSHETYFYAGNLSGLRGSATRALARWSPDQPGYGVALGQYAFALEETGDYAAAESHARLGLEINPEDCWSLHCLAHVYEMQSRQDDALGLLSATQAIWREQNLLSGHIWWHLALRLVEAERLDEALEIFDEALVEHPADEPFRLTDGTSLLWRLELAGCPVGNRWRAIADKWAIHAETHSNAFLDLHAAMAFAACPDLAAAERFIHSLATAHDGGCSENAQTFQRVAKPLAAAIGAFRRHDHGLAADHIVATLDELHRIGGSLAQRELVERSAAATLRAAGRLHDAREFIESRLATWPNRTWLLREMAQITEADGDRPNAEAFRRRAELSLRGWQTPAAPSAA